MRTVSSIFTGKLFVGLQMMMIVIFLSACTEEKNKENPPVDNNSNVASIEDIKMIVEKIKPRQTQAEIKNTVGDAFIELKNPDGSVEWRYDFGAKSDYKFKPESPDEGRADITGLEQGKLLAQLFIRWNNSKVDYITLFYKGADNKIHIYEQTNDGTKKDTVE